MRSYATESEEREMEESTPLKKLSDRQTMLARNALYKLHRAISQLEAAISRDERALTVKVGGYDLTDSAGWPDICRAIARDRYDAVRYWRFWAERYFDLDHALKVRLEHAFVEFDAFAGEPA